MTGIGWTVDWTGVTVCGPVTVIVVTYSVGPMIDFGRVPAILTSRLEWTRPVIEPPLPVHSNVFAAV